MASEKKLFRETRIYPVVFMLIITVIFIGILATFYQLSLERVTKYKDTMMKKMVLGTFDLPVENIELDFDKYISTKEIEGLIFYEAKADSIFLGYCFPISGSGLWGTIQALLAVTPGFDKIINIEIVEQNETPGLGGRITENWFKDQFQGKVMIANDVIQNFSMIPENEPSSGMEINQITGATASSKAVVDMVYKNVKRYSPKLRASL
jgi:Na+-transporting NADH:ubiquinone oxidoreductase subunit C